MSTVTVTKCDMESCREEKKEVNHWFTCWIDKDGEFHACSLGAMKNEIYREKKDACGLDHAQKFFMRFLANGSFSMDFSENKEER